MQMPLVSIVIPTYKQKDHIALAIESALAQEYPNLEVVVADDCSPDDTAGVVQKYLEKDSRLKYFRNRKNLGRVGNYRKTLYEYASGDFTLNLDGDDLLTDNLLVADSIRFFQKFPSVMMVVACKKVHLKDRSFQLLHKIEGQSACITGVDFVLGISKKYEFSHLTTVYDRRRALSCDFYRENIVSSDKESLLRLALLGNVVVYNKVAGQWNQTDGNETSKQKFDDAVENLRWIDNVHHELASKGGELKAFFWKRRMKRLYAKLILRAIKRQGKISVAQIKKLAANQMFTLTITRLLQSAFMKMTGMKTGK